MRLENYLTEAVPELIDNIPAARKAIEKDCQKYLKESGGKTFDERNVLFRGKHGWDGNSLWKVRSRGRPRQPKDTPQILHRMANIAFKKEFGWPVRDGVFTTSNSYMASDYGRVGVFYPIGNYKYVWSPDIDDFYEDVIQSMGITTYKRMDDFEDLYLTVMKAVDLHLYSGDPLRDWMVKKLGPGFQEKPELVTPKVVKEWINYEIGEAIKTYTNRGLIKAISSKQEVSFNVKEYYLAPVWIYE